MGPGRVLANLHAAVSRPAPAPRFGAPMCGLPWASIASFPGSGGGVAGDPACLHSRRVPRRRSWPALNGRVHASAACAWARQPGRRQGSWHPAWRARLPGRGFYLHRQGPAGVSSQIMSTAVQGRSSGPIQPAAGISAPSTETIGGPKLRPPRCAPLPSRHGGSRHRRSVAVEVGFEPTEDLRLHTLSSTAHHRSPPSASVRTSTDVGHAVAGERPRTGVNETKTEPSQRYGWPGRGLAIPSRASDS